MLIQIKHSSSHCDINYNLDSNDYSYSKKHIFIIANLTYGSAYKENIESDLEKICDAYLQGEMEVTDPFNGYYFFVLFDKKNQKILLSKDRVGVLTGYYVKRVDELLIGTNMHTVAQISRSVEFDKTAVLLKLSSMRTFDGLSYYKSVHEILMGQKIIFNKKFEIIFNTVNRIKFPKVQEGLTFSETAKILREKTISAHEKLYGNDNIILLSGGIDSCVMLASLHNVCKNGSSDIHNLTYRVKGTEFDETPFAVEAGRYLN